MNAADARLLRIVQLCVVVTELLQMLLALFRSDTQIIKSAKDDRFRRTNFGAGGNKPALLSIVTKRAFECAAAIRQRLGSTIDYPEWQRDNETTASITDIILHKNGAGLRA